MNKKYITPQILKTHFITPHSILTGSNVSLEYKSTLGDNTKEVLTKQISIGNIDEDADEGEDW